MTSSIPIKVVAAWATFLSKLNDNANWHHEWVEIDNRQNILGSHEGLAIKVCYSVLSILPTTN